MPEIYVFGGCNGSGKTTLATTFLSALPSVEFVNADIIAADLNPEDVDAVAIQASRLMLERLKVLSAQNLDFAFETTLAARTFARFLRECKGRSYKINLFYVWLESSELAIARVARRVASGGHDIPTETIIRRYERGRENFIELYSPIADRWIVYDNSNQRQKIAEKPLNQTLSIYKPQIWQQIIADQS
ncbi:MAG: zeta toxin family protein [Waterburya sp.]